jgi:hypothetical protein
VPGIKAGIVDRQSSAGDSGAEGEGVTTGGFLLLILPAIAGLMAWKMARSWRARASERHWLPKELQHARLAFAEKTFRTWQPISLIARADRGYWLNGELHLAEFKTRRSSRHCC